jgi:hypothetical protein
VERKGNDFTVLRRLAPGRFSEQMLDKLAEHGDQLAKVRIEAVELGDDPFVEKLNVIFHAVNPEGDFGPKLFFTFTAEVSAEENFRDLVTFMEQHMETAASAPQQNRGRRHHAPPGPGGD